MTLGEIKENLEQPPADHHTLDLVGAAHQNAKDTLAELRDLARGIHPPVLDRGLGPALGILAGTSAIPVALTVGRHRTALAGHRGHGLLLHGRAAGQRDQAQRRAAT